MISKTQSLKASKRLLSIEDCSIEDISEIFSIAKSEDFLIQNPGIFVSMFFENSTRTLLSFEKSALNCGFKVLRFEVANSSIAKEETEINTIRTINSLGAASVALRCKKSGEDLLFSKYLNPKISVLNGGDGTNEHPTQSLLDCFTLCEHFKIKFGTACLKGFKIGIMGDVMHSRVARSNIFLLSKLGAEITLISPPNFLTQNFAQYYKLKFGCKILHKLEGKFEAIMLLRVQKERIEGSGKICYPSSFGLFNEEDLNGAVLLHPGPINAGVEVSEKLAYESPFSLVSKQVENGVKVRSAVLKFLHT